MIDTTNLNVREVETPDGTGTLWAFDDRENPTYAIVSVKLSNAELASHRKYNLTELDEIKERS